MKWHYICRCGVKYEKPQKYCLSCRVKGQVEKVAEDGCGCVPVLPDDLGRTAGDNSDLLQMEAKIKEDSDESSNDGSCR